jgi:hypothetical protein
MTKLYKKIAAVGLAAVAAFVFMPSSQSVAELKTEGDGKKQRLDPSQFPPAMRKDYELFAKRCTKCHEMGRPIKALVTGITPISGAKFDPAGIKKYVVKMMRKPNSGISRQDAKVIIGFLRKARKMAETGKSSGK